MLMSRNETEDMAESETGSGAGAEEISGGESDTVSSAESEAEAVSEAKNSVKSKAANRSAATAINSGDSKSPGEPEFADRAFSAVFKVMSGNHKNSMEHLNRANKGEMFVLQFLDVQDTTVIPSELSVALQASTARISALLGSLEKKGQIKREIDKTNRRNILVTITDEGRKRVKSEMNEMRKNITQVFVKMGEDDTLEFVRLLKLFFELSEKHFHCH